MKKILIAGFQPIFYEGLKQILLTNFSFDRLDCANEYSDLLQIPADKKYDILVLDFESFLTFNPNHLSEINSDKILIISACENKDLIRKILKFHLAGYIMKDCMPDEFIKAIDSCLKNEKYFCEYIINILLDKNNSGYQKDNKVHLTHKEIEIINQISKGFTTKEIAKKIHASYHTINTHKKNIFCKLQIHNVSELIMYAVHNGIVDSIEYYI